MARSAFLMISCLFLASCASPKPIEIRSAPVKIAIPAPPEPQPIELKSINWKVLNVDDVIYYGLRVNDYETLAVNMQEIKRYLLAQQQNLEYYKRVTAD